MTRGRETDARAADGRFANAKYRSRNGAPMRALAFTGMPGAGKSVAVEVAHELGVPVVRMGDLVWDEVKRRGLPLAHEHVGRVATEMREKYGKGVWAERTAERVLDTDAEQVVIDGVRTEEEVDVLRARLGHDFVLVAIHASPATRLRRIMGRGREDDPEDARDFHARDERELSWGIGRVIALADVMIVNEDDTSRLRERVRDLVKGEA